MECSAMFLFSHETCQLFMRVAKLDVRVSILWEDTQTQVRIHSGHQKTCSSLQVEASSALTLPHSPSPLKGVCFSQPLSVYVCGALCGPSNVTQEWGVPGGLVEQILAAPAHMCGQPKDCPRPYQRCPLPGVHSGYSACRYTPP